MGAGKYLSKRISEAGDLSRHFTFTRQHIQIDFVILIVKGRF